MRLISANYNGLSRNDNQEDEAEPMIVIKQKLKLNRKVCDRAGLMSFQNDKSSVGTKE